MPLEPKQPKSNLDGKASAITVLPYGTSFKPQGFGLRQSTRSLRPTLLAHSKRLRLLFAWKVCAEPRLGIEGVSLPTPNKTKKE